jgi:methionyl-tRNA synthetase
MAAKYWQSQVPAELPADLSADNPLQQLGLQAGAKATQAYENLAFSQVADVALDLVRLGNKYIDEQAPWSLYKQGNHSQVNHVLYAVLESVRLAACLLAPMIPNVATEIYHQLGFDWHFNLPLGEFSLPAGINFQSHSQWGKLAGGQYLREPRPVFQKLVNEQLENSS